MPIQVQLRRQRPTPQQHRHEHAHTQGAHAHANPPATRIVARADASPLLAGASIDVLAICHRICSSDRVVEEGEALGLFVGMHFNRTACARVYVWLCVCVCVCVCVCGVFIPLSLSVYSLRVFICAREFQGQYVRALQ